MKRAPIKICFIVAVTLLTAAPVVAFQDCGCSGTSGFVVDDSGEYHNSSLGFYASNCGRGITQYEAVALWQGYCNENCSFYDDDEDCGCGLFHRCRLHCGCGFGLRNGCGCGLGRHGWGHGNSGCCGDAYTGDACGCGAAHGFGYPNSGSTCCQEPCDSAPSAGACGCGGLKGCGHRRFFDLDCRHRSIGLRCDGCITGACDQPVAEANGG